MRHAKSDWSVAGQEDFDRVLNKRGRGDLARMGRAIAAGTTPTLVLCSAAHRARETAEGVLPFLSAPEVKYDEGLYLAPPAALHSTLEANGSGAECVLVIAHNPGIQELASRLAGDPKDERTRVLMNAMRTKFPTAALAILTLNTSSWSDMAYGQAHLEDFICPRDLR